MAASGLCTGNGGKQRFEIAVGNFFQGPSVNLALLMEDDADGSGAGTFSGIDLFERPPLIVDGAPERLLSHDPGQDAGTAEVSPDQRAVALAENAWKRLEIGAQIAADTWLAFDVTSDNVGEVLGMGFDANDSFALSDLARLYQRGGR